MREASEDIDEMLQMEFGPPFALQDEQIGGVNQRYFAGLIKNNHKLLFLPEENGLYLYNPTTGAWECQSKEMLKRMIGDEMHRYAVTRDIPDLSLKLTNSMLSSVLELLKGMTQKTGAFSSPPGYHVHCRNGMVCFNMETMTWELRPFAPEYYSRSPGKIDYQADASAPDFLTKLINPAMSLEDSEILRLYFGQCLLRKNISQTLLLLTGTAGGGKSTLVNIIEGVVGHDNCMNMRLEHINGRFEAGRFQGRSLLTSKDVQSEYLGLDGAFRLKMLTGGDLSNTERKNDNSRLELKGEFNVIIVSNTLLRIMLDNDLEAWRRRILWINYENPPPAERISNFDQRLLLAEGSGILNWALEGAAKLLQDGGLIRRGQVQQIKVDVLLKCARSMETFVQSFVAPMPGCAFTTEEAVASFYELCKHFHWPAMPRRKVEQELKEQMLHCYGVSTRTDIKYGTTKRRGYYGFQIRLPDVRV